MKFVASKHPLIFIISLNHKKKEAKKNHNNIVDCISQQQMNTETERVYRFQIAD